MIFEVGKFYYLKQIKGYYFAKVLKTSYRNDENPYGHIFLASYGLRNTNNWMAGDEPWKECSFKTGMKLGRLLL